MSGREPRVHLFVTSVHVDFWGEPICAECDNLQGHRVHRVPELDEQTKVVGERMLGEAS